MALGNVSWADWGLWERFEANAEEVAAEAEEAYARVMGRAGDGKSGDLGTSGDGRLKAELPTADGGVGTTDEGGQDARDTMEGPTEVLRTVRARRVQGFFRAAVLASYEYRCALSEIGVVGLLNASHIVPWAASVERRADPRNGILLNALYDRAFDRGLMTVDEEMRVVISGRLRGADVPVLQRQAFGELEGRRLRMPARFGPDVAALAWHREHVFA